MLICHVASDGAINNTGLVVIIRSFSLCWYFLSRSGVFIQSKYSLITSLCFPPFLNKKKKTVSICVATIKLLRICIEFLSVQDGFSTAAKVQDGNIAAAGSELGSPSLAGAGLMGAGLFIEGELSQVAEGLSHNLSACCHIHPLPQREEEQTPRGGLI